jgi:hypothetical protein
MPESLDAPENQTNEALRQVASGMLAWQHGGVALGALTGCAVVPRYLRRPEGEGIARRPANTSCGLILDPG